ncbi:ABC transporter permease [Ktedonobacter racemifer]|uniref:ABC-2 type transporter n=1 Tax=Ktedonobacter racemifer DSM 44963 TaxID=485913 RepID=D6U1K8_KTERA|nr:ABC transporter permease [Ktedonobacter racemifer]EFH82652.1 ABC-2 type transporter [Ktedonobacter racemifer DSM 44963]
MKTLWSIAKKDLLQVMKDKGSLVLLLLVPLILITTVGLAFGNLYSNSSTQITIKVAISNQETASDAYLGKTLVNALKINTSQLQITVNEYHTSAQVIDQVKAPDGATNVGIIVPTGASQALIGGTPQHIAATKQVQFYTLPNNNDARITIVRNIVNEVVQAQLTGNAAVNQVYAVCNQPGNHCTPGTIHPISIAASVVSANRGSDQAIQTLSAGEATKVSAFDQLVPGYAVFFALFGLNAVAATILQEKEDGTFRRLLVAPIQKYALLGGKLLAQFLLTLTQLVVLFAIGYFVFKMHIGSWPSVILLLVSTSFATTGLGTLLVSLVRTRRQVNPIVSLVTLVTSAIGGAWWPLFIEPKWMQQLAKIGITAWAMEGLNGSMIFGKGFMDILPDILGLLAYGAICFIIALRFFRFQEKVATA